MIFYARDGCRSFHTAKTRLGHAQAWRPAVSVAVDAGLYDVSQPLPIPTVLIYGTAPFLVAVKFNIDVGGANVHIRPID